MRIGIFGAGGQGRELVQPLRESLTGPADGAQLVFIDDNATEAILPVLSLSGMSAGDRFLCAVGNGRRRQEIERRCLDAGLQPFSFFAASSYVADTVEVGPGAIFTQNTVATADARIGRQFLCGVYAYVSHDCVIGDYVTLAPRASINGNIHIRDFAYVGSGAVIRQGTPDKPLVIGEGATVGCGAVVLGDVPPGATVVGNPARALK
jgi:sugar O-acyltransferase (sialic acid O-acetyltransferase NeuD family)